MLRIAECTNGAEVVTGIATSRPKNGHCCRGHLIAKSC